VPGAPPAPVYESADDTKIDMSLIESPDNNGAFIDYYELWRNEGTAGSVFTKLTNYDGFSNTYSLKVSDFPVNTLFVGRIYSF